MSKQVSFIHAADLHLDSPFTGLAHVPKSIFSDIRESTFSTLDRLVQVAIKKSVNFVLLVGDLFDYDKQSLKAHIKLRAACEKLQEHGIVVYISHGNHDYLNAKIHSITYPDNVFIFPDEKIRHFIYTYNQEPLAAIYGFSYENEAVFTNKAKQYNIKDSSIPFHIATLHGSLQTNTENDTYAPFRLTDLKKRNFSYWALGHIHQRCLLSESPPIVYPGNTQGRHHKEDGEKGCYHVVLTETNSYLSFIPIQTIQFQSITIDVSSCDDIDNFEQTIRQRLKPLQRRTTPLLVSLQLTSNHPKLYEWEQYKYIDDIVDVFNESFVEEKDWIYIYRITTHVKQSSLIDIVENDHFISELTKQFQDTPIDPLLTDLYGHRQGRKFVNHMTQDEALYIKQKAEQLLIQALLKGEGE